MSWSRFWAPLPRFSLRWPSPGEAQAYDRARRGEATKAAGKSNSNTRARARALVRDQLKDGPKPEASIMAAAEAAEIPETFLIAAACVLRVPTQKGQWWLPGAPNASLVGTGWSQI
jgi:hypothetical protein